MAIILYMKEPCVRNDIVEQYRKQVRGIYHRDIIYNIENCVYISNRNVC